MFFKIDRLLIKSFTQNFKEKHHHERKESPRDYLPEKASKEKSPKDMSIYESFHFSEGVIGVAKIIFD